MLVDFRDWIYKKDYKPYRYLLVISLSCPYAHKVYICYKLKKLQMHLSIAHPIKSQSLGWRFVKDNKECPPCQPDRLHHTLVSEYYYEMDPNFFGCCSIPFVYDLEDNRIVNNNSDDLIQMFNDLNSTINYYPKCQRIRINQMNEYIYELFTYIFKAGLTTNQEQYNTNATLLFYALDLLDFKLGSSLFLNGNTLTSSDIHFFPIILRFDIGYACIFRLNLKAVNCNYPNILAWAKRCYPMMKDTFNMHHILINIYSKEKNWGGNGVIPIGRGIDFKSRHNTFYRSLVHNNVGIVGVCLLMLLLLLINKVF